MDFSKLTLGDKILGGCGVLLVLFMLFLDWHSAFGFGIGPLSGDGEAVAWPAFLALLLTIALVAVVAIRRFTTTKLPDLPVPWNQAIFYASIAVPVLLLLKLRDEERDHRGHGLPDDRDRGRHGVRRVPYQQGA